MTSCVQYALQVERLNKTYRPRGARASMHAVKDLSFALKPGEVAALLGPNGAGKTTAIKCICQLITPSSGRVAVMGFDARRDSLRAIARLATSFDGPRNVDMQLSVRENLEWFAGLQGISRGHARAEMDALLETFSLTDKCNAITQTLSRGTVQRLSLACCLIKRADVILLDEPTLGLDHQSSHELRAIIKRLAHNEGKTLLISSHDMAAVQDVCTRALVMRRAELVADAKLTSLMERFSSQAQYEITVRVDPTESLHRGLRLCGLAFERNPTTGRFSVRIKREGEGLHRVLNALRESRVQLESVASHQPTIESVLRQLLQDDVSGNAHDARRGMDGPDT